MNWPKDEYSAYMEMQKKEGRVKTLSSKTTEEIDIHISEAFFIASKKAAVKQLNSVRLLRNYEPKGTKRV